MNEDGAEVEEDEDDADDMCVGEAAEERALALAGRRAWVRDDADDDESGRATFECAEGDEA